MAFWMSTDSVHPEVVLWHSQHVKIQPQKHTLWQTHLQSTHTHTLTHSPTHTDRFFFVGHTHTQRHTHTHTHMLTIQTSLVLVRGTIVIIIISLCIIVVDFQHFAYCRGVIQHVITWNMNRSKVLSSLWNNTQSKYRCQIFQCVKQKLQNTGVRFSSE